MPKLNRQRRHLCHARSLIGRSAAVNPTPPDRTVIGVDVSADPADETSELSDDDDDNDPEIIVADPTMEEHALSEWDELIKWKDGARPVKRSEYLGSSKRTQFRKQHEKIRRIESSRDCKT